MRANKNPTTFESIRQGGEVPRLETVGIVAEALTIATQPLAKPLSDGIIAGVGALRRAGEAGVILLDRWVVKPIARRRRRSAAHRELVRLDDRILADIGIRRDEIPAIVGAILTEQEAKDPRRRGAANENEPPVAA